MTTPQAISRFRKIISPFALIVLSIAIPLALVNLSCNRDSTSSEDHVNQAFTGGRRLGEPNLYAFLRNMPKGADLHMHLSGAIYAETFLKDAAADNLCVNPRTLSFIHKDPKSAPGAKCATDTVPASSVFSNQKLYDSLIDSFSMRSFVPFAGVSGHDQFFATFDRFGGLDKSHNGEWLDEVASRAAAQNEQYLEVMMTPGFFDLKPLWDKLGWPATPADAEIDPQGDATGTSRPELEALRTKLLAGGLDKEIAVDKNEIDTALAARRRIEHCDTPNPAPACAVKIRVIYQVLRAFPPQQVFAQTLLAFETAMADPNVVGLNFVQPEDAYMAMSEYNRQMHMLDYLHSVYPQVHISLHAGELAPEMVTPGGLTFHIREAVALGHAERIGHGVDVLHENNSAALLKELADQHVMVEINLTSNDVILGIKGSQHPLAAYLAAHVPVALSTDDEGVSRIDLTHEYVRAVEDQGMDYLALKRMARASLEHSFLPGDSLWAQKDDFTAMRGACAGSHPEKEDPASDCKKLLDASEKAAQQWELERRFVAFEGGQP